MHVLFLPSWYPTDAHPHAGRYLHEQAQALRRAGVQVGVVYPEQRSLRTVSWTALQQHHFQDTAAAEGGVPTWRHHSWNVWWRLPLRRRLRAWNAQRLARRYVARAGRPDLIHAHSARWAAAAARDLAAALGCPYVVTEHYSGFLRGSLPAAEAAWAQRGFAEARRVFAVSPALRDALVRGGFAAPGRASVLPNAVDTDFFELPPRPRPAAPFRFAALGDLRPVKGFDVLLRAFAAAFRGAGDVELHVGGDGPERAALARQAAALGVRPQVRFRGHLDRAAVRRLFWSARAFVLSSHHETFGVALAEAMATGLPTVATACGGPAALVTPETGHLVPPGDPAALAEALRAMRRSLSGPAAFDASAIRAYIVNRFSPPVVTQQLIAHYRDTL